MYVGEYNSLIKDTFSKINFYLVQCQILRENLFPHMMQYQGYLKNQNLGPGQVA